MWPNFYLNNSIDGFPMVKILEIRELSSLCLGTLLPREDRKRPDKAVLTPKAFVAVTNFFQI